MLDLSKKNTVLFKLWKHNSLSNNTQLPMMKYQSSFNLCLNKHWILFWSLFCYLSGWCKWSWQREKFIKTARSFEHYHGTFSKLLLLLYHHYSCKKRNGKRERVCGMMRKTIVLNDSVCFVKDPNKEISSILMIVSFFFSILQTHHWICYSSRIEKAGELSQEVIR